MTVEATAPGPTAYPARFEADYIEPLSRLSTFFRLILMIPLAAVVAILGGGGFFDFGDVGADDAERGFQFSVGALGSLIIVHWIAVVLRQRPVTWLFDAIAAIQRFVLRATSYFLLLTDRYPPFEGDWAVRFEVDQPERLSRWQVFIWKTIASIPHFIILFALSAVVAVMTLVSWVAIVF